MTTLSALLDRVSEARGGDREIDHLVHDALVEPIGNRIYNTKANGGQFICADVTAPEYTASIDAALALVEKKLPGWAWKLDRAFGEPPYIVAVVASRPIDVTAAHAGEAPTAPLAILSALLRALISQSESMEKKDG